MNQYLSQLIPNKKLEGTWIGNYISNIRLVSLALLLVIIAGVVSFLQVPRRLNPEVDIALVIVNTVLPGASPNDVERLVTIPIEDSLDDVENVTDIRSTSEENVSSVVIEFENGVNPDEARDDVQKAIDTVNDLPDDATDPNVFKLDFENEPVWSFGIIGNLDPASLNEVTNTLVDKLESDKAIDSASATGLAKREVQIVIKPETLQEYELNPRSLQQAVSTSLSAFPAGTITSNQNSVSLSIDPSVDSVEDLRNLKVTIDGETIPLSSIATVIETSVVSDEATYITKGVASRGDEEAVNSPSVAISIFKSSSANIDEAVVKAEEIVNEYKAETNNAFEIITILNNAEEINSQFDELLNNFLATIVLVFLTLFSFLGIRQALIASFSIPLTFLISFTVMNISGISLNFLSMFSLLLALGLVVDDAIVIIAAMTDYYKTGKFSTKETAFLVWQDFITPIWTTTITTVWAFVPLLLATGLIGSFIKSIPVVVSATLLASTSVAVLVTLPLMKFLLKPELARRVVILFKIIAIAAVIAAIYFALPGNFRPIFKVMAILFAMLLLGFTFAYRKILADKIGTIFHNNVSDKAITRAKGFRTWLRKSSQTGIINTQVIKARYHLVLDKILSSKKNRRLSLWFVVIFAIFSYTLLPLGLVVNEFFPPGESDIVYVNVQLPVGTKSEITERVMLDVLDRVVDTPETNYITSSVGRADPLNDANSPGPNTALLTLSLLGEDERTQSSIDIAQGVRDKFVDYTDAKISVVEISGGPPVGSDIEIRLLGDNLDTLEAKANETITFLEENEATTNVQKSILPGVSKISFVPNLDALQEAGLNVGDVAFWLRTFATGFEYDEIDIEDDTYDIVFKMSSETQSVTSLGGLNIPTNNGLVQLSTLGDLVLKPNPTKITRSGGKRSIAVSAAVKDGFNIPAVGTELEEFADTELNLPTGYEWETGGANEENNESVQSIIQAMGLAFFLILITMVIQLGSFRKSIVVLLVIPLATSGVFTLFALTGIPLTFPGLIGMLALFGIVVNNSIMVVEKINQNLNVNIPFKDAVLDGASSRLEPIMFSSLTTIMGLVPITITDPLWRGLGGAIIAGLSFSGAIMLFFIPTVYYMLYHKDYSQQSSQPKLLKA